MQEQRVVGLGAVNEPAHGTDDVLLGRVHDRVLLVICQEHHVLSLVPKPLDEELGQVLNIVDAAPELSILTKVVDTNQEGLALSSTVGVLEGVAFRRTVTKLLGCCRGRRTGPGAMTGVPGLVERIAIGVEAGRGGISRRRRSAMGLLASVAATTATISGPGRGRLVTVTVTAGRGRRGRTVVTAAAAALISLIGAAASLVRARAVVALARVASAVVRHDDWRGQRDSCRSRSAHAREAGECVDPGDGS